MRAARWLTVMAAASLVACELVVNTSHLDMDEAGVDAAAPGMASPPASWGPSFGVASAS